MYIADILKKAKPFIAILNTSIELVEALEMAMQQAGFRTLSATVTSLKKGKTSLAQLFRKEKPEVIIYDIAIPYKENWEYLQAIRAQTKYIGDARFILTTTNKEALERLLNQKTDTFEITGIVGKPFDLDLLVEAVKNAVKAVEKQKELNTKN